MKRFVSRATLVRGVGLSVLVLVASQVLAAGMTPPARVEMTDRHRVYLALETIDAALARPNQVNLEECRRLSRVRTADSTSVYIATIAGILAAERETSGLQVENGEILSILNLDREDSIYFVEAILNCGFGGDAFSVPSHLRSKFLTAQSMSGTSAPCLENSPQSHSNAPIPWR